MQNCEQQSGSTHPAKHILLALGIFLTAAGFILLLVFGLTAYQILYNPSDVTIINFVFEHFSVQNTSENLNIAITIDKETTEISAPQIILGFISVVIGVLLLNAVGIAIRTFILTGVHIIVTSMNNTFKSKGTTL